MTGHHPNGNGVTAGGRLFVGVHRRVEPPALGEIPWGPLIHAVTVARWGHGGKAPPAGWSFVEGPATHAFALLRDVSGAFVRVDADIPQSVLTQVPALSRAHLPDTRLWEVHNAPSIGVDAFMGQTEFWNQAAVRYDVVQAVAQGLAPLLPAFIANAADFKGPPGQGDICTESACRVLMACGGVAAKLAKQVMEADHLPEELSMALRYAEGAPWLSAVALL